MTEHGYHSQFASSMVCLTIAEGEEGEEEERRPVDLLASPQVKREGAEDSNEIKLKRTVLSLFNHSSQLA